MESIRSNIRKKGKERGNFKKKFPVFNNQGYVRFEGWTPRCTSWGLYSEWNSDGDGDTFSHVTIGGNNAFLYKSQPGKPQASVKDKDGVAQYVGNLGVFPAGTLLRHSVEVRADHAYIAVNGKKSSTIYADFSDISKYVMDSIGSVGGSLPFNDKIYAARVYDHCPFNGKYVAPGKANSASVRLPTNIILTGDLDIKIGTFREDWNQVDRTAWTCVVSDGTSANHITFLDTLNSNGDNVEFGANGTGNAVWANAILKIAEGQYFELLFKRRNGVIELFVDGVSAGTKTKADPFTIRNFGYRDGGARCRRPIKVDIYDHVSKREWSYDSKFDGTARIVNRPAQREEYTQIIPTFNKVGNAVAKSTTDYVEFDHKTYPTYSTYQIFNAELGKFYRFTGYAQGLEAAGSHIAVNNSGTYPRIAIKDGWFDVTLECVYKPGNDGVFQLYAVNYSTMGKLVSINNFKMEEVIKGKTLFEKDYINGGPFHSEDDLANWTVNSGVLSYVENGQWKLGRNNQNDSSFGHAITSVSLENFDDPMMLEVELDQGTNGLQFEIYNFDTNALIAESQIFTEKGRLEYMFKPNAHRLKIGLRLRNSSVCDVDIKKISLKKCWDGQLVKGNNPQSIATIQEMNDTHTEYHESNEKIFVFDEEGRVYDRNYTQGPELIDQVEYISYTIGSATGKIDGMKCTMDPGDQARYMFPADLFELGCVYAYTYRVYSGVLYGTDFCDDDNAFIAFRPVDPINAGTYTAIGQRRIDRTNSATYRFIDFNASATASGAVVELLSVRKVGDGQLINIRDTAWEEE